MSTGGKPRSQTHQGTFEGLPPSKPRLKWLNELEPNPDATELIRLVVDDDRWDLNQANASYQRYALDEVSAFVKKLFGRRRPVIVSPAGFITASLQRAPDATESEIDRSSEDLEIILKTQYRLSHAKQHDWLVGLDGCLPGLCTPIQTVFRLAPSAHMQPQQVAIKLYPESGEMKHLVCWHLILAQGSIPAALSRKRWSNDTGRSFLSLVCHEAVAFSSRSLSTSKHPSRDHFRKHIKSQGKNKLDYITVSAHWLSPASSSAFKDGLSNLATALGATVVVSMFSEGNMLTEAAREFAPVGGVCAEKIATLLVH
ncbi:hypothetical protein [Stigmatella erecta]|uniref:Uncharacterized protein n=1 Tax=Stigmatella erecta TaxID=83460 RepID=A0A1H9YP87_9BACT|nr:hypothetical protein [Stigmatella erecta]SES70904.1 hypothetical protein SAMN05443639_1014 [Stigmatella erecta]